MPRLGDASAKGLQPHMKNPAFYAGVSFLLLKTYIDKFRKIRQYKAKINQQQDSIIPSGYYLMRSHESEQADI